MACNAGWVEASGDAHARQQTAKVVVRERSTVITHEQGHGRDETAVGAPLSPVRQRRQNVERGARVGGDGQRAADTKLVGLGALDHDSHAGGGGTARLRDRDIGEAEVRVGREEGGSLRYDLSAAQCCKEVEQNGEAQAQEIP